MPEGLFLEANLLPRLGALEVEKFHRLTGRYLDRSSGRGILAGPCLPLPYAKTGSALLLMRYSATGVCCETTAGRAGGQN